MGSEIAEQLTAEEANPMRTSTSFSIGALNSLAGRTHVSEKRNIGFLRSHEELWHFRAGLWRSGTALSVALPGRTRPFTCNPAAWCVDCVPKGAVHPATTVELLDGLLAGDWTIVDAAAPLTRREGGSAHRRLSPVAHRAADQVAPFGGQR